jgi:hypothetical protein
MTQTTLAEYLANATSREQAREALAPMTVKDLRSAAKHLGVTVGTRDGKGKIIDVIVRVTVGARLDSLAILSVPRAHDVM